MKTRIFTLLLFFMTLPSTQGINYYLDASGGNDKNKGTTKTKPWQTLSKINAVELNAGDTLFLKTGTRYDGQLATRGSGTEQAPLVVTSYGGLSKPRIDAGGVFQTALLIKNQQYIKVSNLELTNTGETRIPKQSGLLIQAEDGGTLHQIMVSNLYIHDVNGSLVKKQGGGQGIEIRNGGKITPSNFEGILIENCHIVRTERNGIIFNSDYWARDKWFPNLGVVVRSCLLEEIPGDGIVPIGCEGALVERNRMRNCTRLLPESEAAAGIWPWSSDHTIIQYNEVSDHKAPWDAQGFDCDYNCVGTVIQYNYSHDNEGGFMLVCSPSDQRWPWSIGNDSSIVRHNLSVNDGFRLTGKHSGFSPAFLLTGPVSNTTISDNTIIVPKKPAGCDLNLVKMDTWGGRWPSNTTFRGNTFYVTDSASISLGKDVNTIFFNNLYTGKVTGIPENDVKF
jgi:hypothetical protein